MQKPALPLLACLLALSVASAHAQSLWKWRDAAGEMHISDSAPPAGTPAASIISGPPGGVAVPASLSPAAATAPTARASAPAAPSALERKKKAAEQEKADQQKAERAAVDARNAAIHKDNCARAQAALGSLQSGQRIARLNDKGEREIMDDATRATEIKRAQDVIASNCGAAPSAAR